MLQNNNDLNINEQSTINDNLGQLSEEQDPSNTY